MKLYKVPYLFWNASSAIWIADSRLKPLYKQIDNKYFPNFYDTNFQQNAILQRNGGTQSFKHWDEKTQIWWATYLYEYIQEKYTF